MANEKSPCERSHVAWVREREYLDPSDLWLDLDLDEETLIELDPLDITEEMVEIAEHPDLADPVFLGLSKPRYRD